MLIFIVIPPFDRVDFFSSSVLHILARVVYRCSRECLQFLICHNLVYVFAKCQFIPIYSNLYDSNLRESIYNLQ